VTILPEVGRWMSIRTNQTTLRHTPDDSDFRSLSREELKSRRDGLLLYLTTLHHIQQVFVSNEIIIIIMNCGDVVKPIVAYFNIQL
jgi:hypothetical protein